MGHMRDKRLGRQEVNFRAYILVLQHACITTFLCSFIVSVGNQPKLTYTYAKFSSLVPIIPLSKPREFVTLGALFGDQTGSLFDVSTCSWVVAIGFLRIKKAFVSRSAGVRVDNVFID